MTNRNHSLNDRDALRTMHATLTQLLAFLTEFHTDNISDDLDTPRFDDFASPHANARFDAMHFSDDDTDYAPAAANLIAALTNALYSAYEYESPSTNLDLLLDISDNIDDLLTAPYDSDLYEIAEKILESRSDS